MATITSFPHTVDLTLSRTSNGCVAETVAGAGYGGSLALRCVNRATDQGYAGPAYHTFPRTKRINIRRLLKAEGQLPRAKWDVVQKYDGAIQLDTVSGCHRYIVNTRPDQQGRTYFSPRQGVCTQDFNTVNQSGFNLDDYVNQWICIETEADLNTGLYSVYVSTPDNVYNNTLMAQIDIATSTVFPETVPSPYEWGAFDGLFWDEPNTTGTAVFISDMIVSDSFIGSPFSVPVPQPEPTPVLAPIYTGGRFHVMVNGVELSWHTQEKEAYEAAGRAILTDPTDTVEILTDVVRVTLD